MVGSAVTTAAVVASVVLPVHTPCQPSEKWTMGVGLVPETRPRILAWLWYTTVEGRWLGFERPQRRPRLLVPAPLRSHPLRLHCWSHVIAGDRHLQ